MRVKRIRIIGVGNLLMGDDGVGVEVARLLSQHPLPEGVEVIDGGTGGLSLLPYIEESDGVIFVDAVDAKETPGTVIRLSVEEILSGRDGDIPFSLHEAAVPDLLRLASELGITPRSVLFGVQVASVTPGIGLSPLVAESLDRMVGLILDEVHSLF